MFITFGMFIGLIIATIIMIALIIYLTFTGSQKNKSLQKDTQQALAEAAAKERLEQNNSTLLHQDEHLYSENIEQPNEVKLEAENNTHDYRETTHEEITEDDYSFDILPYPKDNNFK